MSAPVYLVGLAGPAGVGKSTVAKALCGLSISMHLPRFRRHRFAGPLKDMLRALGLTDEQLDGSEKEKPCALLGGKTPRLAQRSLGTEWGRDCIDPDIWARATMIRVQADVLDGYGVAVDDVRFDNEAQPIIDRGGIVVELTRAGVTASHEHVSEVGITRSLISYTVSNDQAPSATALHIAALLHNHRSQS